MVVQALSPEHSAALHKVIATFVKHADEEEDKVQCTAHTSSNAPMLKQCRRYAHML